MYALISLFESCLLISAFISYQFFSVQIPIKRSRALAGCKEGHVSIAVNGRSGRRVACVLDDKGLTMESFDLEGDGDDGESDGYTDTG